MKKESQRRELQVDIQTQTTEQDKYIIGLIPFNSISYPIVGNYIEMLSPTAFNKTLADGKNVQCLFSHDWNKVLGNLKSGTLQLTVTAEGLLIKCKLNNTSFAQDCWEQINTGVVNTLSFDFYFVKDEYQAIDGKMVNVLQEIDLREVSFCVSNPAFGSTDSIAQKRSLLLQKRSIDLNEIADILLTEKIEEGQKENVTILVEALDKISKPVSLEPSIDTQAEQRSIDLSGYFNKLDEQKRKITWN